MSALLGTDQISSADKRSSVLVQSSDDRLTEVGPKSVAIITAVINQDGMQNIFRHAKDNQHHYLNNHDISSHH